MRWISLSVLISFLPSPGGRGRGRGSSASIIFMKSPLTPKAKTLRQRSTDAERLLWRYLRSNQLHGVKFRRQQPIGKFIVDFVCFSEKLIIELDGGQHAQEKDRLKDSTRDYWLKQQGFKVLRFWDTDVLTNIEGVVETIFKEVIPSIED